MQEFLRIAQAYVKPFLMDLGKELARECGKVIAQEIVSALSNPPQAQPAAEATGEEDSPVVTKTQAPPKETITFELEPIMYGKKEVDRGIVLGEREFRWTLKRKYTPCYAKTDEGYISQLSPHKRGFKVYIPAVDIVERSKMQIFKRERDEEGERLDVLVMKKTGNYVECEVLNRKIEPRPTVKDKMDKIKEMMMSQPTEPDEVVF